MTRITSLYVSHSSLLNASMIFLYKAHVVAYIVTRIIPLYMAHMVTYVFSRLIYATS
jgi:hypothetical protein